jgi:thymidylate synthase (FAD)
MKVRLVSITGSVGELNLTAEELIVYCARVSNPSNQLNLETAPKLLAYLIKHAHWSPFEMVDMTVEIQTSRAIAAQILRHRSFSFQEFSQRYAEVTALEPVEFRMQGKTNRQVGDGAAKLPHHLQLQVGHLLAETQRVYGELLSIGVAKESARMLLPLTTQTTLYMKGSIRSWIHYFQVRATQHTQKEHRDIAVAIKDDIFAINFPNLNKALYSNNENV